MNAKVLLCAALVLAATASRPTTALAAQPGQAAPAYTLLTGEGRRPLAVRRVNGQDMFSLDELAALFDLSVREDSRAGGLTITSRGQTIVLSSGQTLASVGGRLISMSAPAILDGRTWLVPVEFVSRALGLVSGTRIDLRRPSRLIIVGDLTVPRVSVRIDTEGSSRARVTVDVDPPAAHSVAQDGDRLLVDFEADAVDVRLGRIQAGPLVTAVRPADAAAGLVVSLGPAFTAFQAADVAGTETSARFVIELVGTVPEPPPPDVTAPPPPAEDPSAAGPPPVPPPASGPPPPPEAGSILGLTQTAAMRAIVIDPGHGGEEHGARGRGGALEKNITLAVAQKLKAAIESRLGIRVLMTRDADQSVALDERAARANNNKADLFISLHANASARGATSGAEVFYLSLEEYGREAERAARSEGIALPVFGGGSREIEMILWETAQARYLDESAVFAGMVEAELRQRVPMSPRAIQQAPFRVLVGANMPAVLVEMGFITNRDQEQALASDAFQSAVVDALIESILRFRAYLRATRAAGPATPAPGPPGRP